MAFDTPLFATFLLPPIGRSHRKSQTSTNNITSLTIRSTSSTVSTNVTMSKSPMGLSLTESARKSPNSSGSYENSLKNEKSLPNQPFLRSHLTHHCPTTLRCLKCSTDFAYTTQILSKGFTGRLGWAYLVAPPPLPPYVPSFPPKPRPKAELVNTRTEQPVNREMMTGWHIVADVTCVVCSTVVGWKYIETREKSQRYKIGKIILEKQRVCVNGIWGDEDVSGLKTDFKSQIMEDFERGKSDSDVQFDSSDEDECENLFLGIWDKDVVARKRKSGMAAGRGSSSDPVQIIHNST